MSTLLILRPTFSDFTIYHESPQDVEARVLKEVNHLRNQEGLDSVRADGALRTLGIAPLKIRTKEILHRVCRLRLHLATQKICRIKGVRKQKRR